MFINMVETKKINHGPDKIKLLFIIFYIIKISKDKNNENSINLIT